MAEKKQAQAEMRGVPSGDDKQYPKGIALASIMLGVYLSVFLVALVSSGNVWSSLRIITEVGSNDHCHGHPHTHK